MKDGSYSSLPNNPESLLDPSLGDVQFSEVARKEEGLENDSFRKNILTLVLKHKFGYFPFKIGRVRHMTHDM